MISVSDGTNEMSLVTDVTMGGSSLEDGQVEVMVHRRCQADDHRGVQEPLNETMCGCNDIGAQPGKMGAHGHEGDGGCVCDGLTIRGSFGLILDTVENSHAARRQLVEDLNFPATLAFTKGEVKRPKFSSISGVLPANLKLMTVSSNYAQWNDGKIIIRLAHMYQVGEHPILSQPATVSLTQVFAKAGFKISSSTGCTETMLTANQAKESFEAKKKVWKTASAYPNVNVYGAQTNRTGLRESEGNITVTVRAMEVKTFLCHME
jgi:alpha-mannosidase